jgi:hypothetical protein
MSLRIYLDVDVTWFAHRFHFEPTSISLRFHFDFNSTSLRFHFGFTSTSLRAHFEFSLISIRLHFDLTSDSLRFHFEFTSKSLRFSFDLLSISHGEKGNALPHKGKGKLGGAKEKGKTPSPHLSSNSTWQPDRAHARTKRNDFPVGVTPPTSDI